MFRRLRPSVLVATAAALAACSPAPAPAGVTTTAPSPAAPAVVSSAASSAPGGVVVVTAHRCDPAQLALSLAVAGGADPGGALLRFVNTGTTACRMTGFPGVDLLGPNDPDYGPTYQVPRASAAVTTVTLTPGSTAHAVLHVLTPQEGTRWIPAHISVTPPDATRQLASDWPGIAVLRQDAATHPGTYIGPVLAGAGSLTELD